MTCTNCGNEQANGQYCWRCGAKLVVAAHGFHEQIQSQNGQTVSEAAVVNVESNVHLDNVKKQTKEYWSYFVKHLKHPSVSLTKQDDEFRNSFISLLLYAAICGFSIYTALTGVGLAGSTDGGLSFSSIFLNVAGFVAVCIAIVSFGLFIIGNNFGPAYPFKQTLVVYVSHLLPAIVIGLAALLFLLMKSYWYGVFLLIVSLLYVLIISPGYVITVLLSKKPKGIDPLYGYTAYTVLIIVLFGVLFKLLAIRQFYLILMGYGCCSKTMNRSQKKKGMHPKRCIPFNSFLNCVRESI